MSESVAERIKLLERFRQALIKWDSTGEDSYRAWLNKSLSAVRREIVEAGCMLTVTITPPPAIGGLMMRNVDPFSLMFEAPYGVNVTSFICDMIDRTVGELENPRPKEKKAMPKQRISAQIQKGYAFIAMAINPDDHQAVDVLEAIKQVSSDFNIVAERIDEAESNDRITDRILASIDKAEFVIVDLTNERPNVFYEAGYAHGIGKVPIYIARDGTKIHFDVKDYPVILFRNMKELKERLQKRLMALRSRA